MAAFQIGIMAGSFAGGLLYERSVLAMLAASAVLIGAGAAGMAAERQLFDVPATRPPVESFPTIDNTAVQRPETGPASRLQSKLPSQKPM